MKALLLGLLVLAAVPRVARADGMIRCSDPDKNNGSCNATGVDSATVGSSLLLLGAVAYGIARRKRR
ncbi:MAG TPA: MYXO-CTERM sorting domain-containing protein [Kofleriaceae bacterium]